MARTSQMKRSLRDAGARSSGLAVNTALRATTTAIHSALFLGLAIWLEPAELGLFGLISATIGLAVYLYGHDFYTYTVRELSVAELGKVRIRLRDQFLLFAVIYVLGSLILVSMLPRFGLDPTLAVLAAAIAICQHATLELYRALLRLEQTLSATLSFFIREAAWIPACPLLFLIQGGLELRDVLVLWLLGSIVGIGAAATFILRATPAAPPGPVDRAWLARGVRTGLRMLPGTLSLRGLFTVDRMILAALVPPEALGAYVFFTAICGAGTGLFDTGIMPYYWPRLLEAARNGDQRGHAEALRDLTRTCLIGVPPIAAISIALGAVLAALLPHKAYSQHIELLFWVAPAYMFITLSNIPHYRLYAANLDLAIVLSNAGAFASFVVVAGALALVWAGLAVPIALLTAAVLLLALKSAAVRRYGA